MDTNDGVENVELGETSQGVSSVCEVEQCNGVHQSIDASSSVPKTIYNIEVTLNDNWAQLEVDVSWGADGKRFYCYSKRYRAGSNNNKEGNVHLQFYSGGGNWGEHELTSDDAIQDGVWRSLPNGGYIVANQSEATVRFRYMFDFSDANDHDSEKKIVIPFVPAMPSIKPIGNVNSRTFTVTGAGGVLGVGTITLHSASGAWLATATNSGSNWEANVSMSASVNTLTFKARQTIGTKYSETSNVTVYLAAITAPAPSVPLVTGDVFSGIGAPGTTMRTVKHDNRSFRMAPDVNVMPAGKWEAAFTPASLLPSGPVTVDARFILASVSDGFTAPVTYNVLGSPAITAPAANSLQPQTTFTVSGNNGLEGATVEVYIDATPTKVGSGPVLSGGTWSVPVTVPVGPVSLAALEKMSDKVSVRGAHRAFKVQPGRPTLLSQPKGEGVELHGTGHTGARMDIHFVGQVYPFIDAMVVAGIWAKDIPSGLVPGNKNITGRQSVSDGGSERIFSDWSGIITVNIPTPKPTDFKVKVNGQRPEFTGDGRLWDTYVVKIGIYNKGAALAGVPQADVQKNLTWSTTATTDLAPGVYTNLTARQWVNDQWSIDTAEISMTLPSPTPVFTKPEADALTGQRPQVSGTAWPESAIALKISGKPDVPLTATGGAFTLSAEEDWAPRTYTIEATAIFGGQTSSIATRTFTVKTPVPVITTPAESEVDLVPVINGTGYPECWVFIYSTTHLELGRGPVGGDGKWTVELAERAPGALTFYAKQKENENSLNVSDNTANWTVTVRLAPPVISVPAQNDRPARKSVFSGTASYGGTIELYHEGEALPFIKDIFVHADGNWEQEVELPVGGPKTVIAKVRKTPHLSAPFERIVTVVPVAPVIDTPRTGEALGAVLRISGFGYPGDTIRVYRRTHWYDLGSTTVTSSGTWTYSRIHNMVEGDGITALAEASAGLVSVDSAMPAPALLLNSAPQITEPLAGDWVGVWPLYSGLATPGASIAVASWFNAEDVLAPSTVADAHGRWAVTGNKDLPEDAARVKVRQTLDSKASEWVESGRFIVERKTAQFEAPSVHYPSVGQEVGRRPMFAGTGVPGAEIIIVKQGDLNTVLGKTLVDRHGKWALHSQIELPVVDALYTYSVRQSRDDVVSAWLLPERTVKVIQVLDGFAKPTIDKPEDDEAQVLERRPVFSGTGMPGAEVKVYQVGTDTIYATATVDAQGSWSARCVIELPVLEIAYEITARQFMDGQYSNWIDAVRRFKVAEILERPVIVSPVKETSVPPRAVIRGTAMPGVEVRLYKSGDGITVWGSGIADVQGHWVIVAKELPLGDFTMVGRGYKDTLISGWVPELKLVVVNAG